MADIANKYAGKVCGRLYVNDQCMTATCAWKPYPLIRKPSDLFFSINGEPKAETDLLS
jgi:hypothetical protein